uniref:Reverse transcriptase domain-containing protein n=1 Tax=Sphaeramia orbicularis TaxID=375764 RepID=A0A672ZIS7_9TELE
KQGCPLSSALYVLAISPLIKSINSDIGITGIPVGQSCLVKPMAYADDIIAVIKTQLEMDVLTKHLRMYEMASGAVLNHNKTEGVWIRNADDKPNLNIQTKEEIKILGITFGNNNCGERNWDQKMTLIKEEVNRWQNKNTNYKSRINIVKIHVLSKLFLANIFPPTEKMIMRLNKQCANLIRGTIREVTKRTLLFKSKELGGLRALDLSLKLNIAFIKNVSMSMSRKAIWIDDLMNE